MEREPIACTWNGKQYPSINAAARDVGVSGPCMYYRMQRGYTCDVDMIKDRCGTSCIWNGVTYPSMGLAASALGIAPFSMTRRIRQGYSRDEDLGVRGKISPRLTDRERRTIRTYYLGGGTQPVWKVAENYGTTPSRILEAVSDNGRRYWPKRLLITIRKP